MGRPYEGGKGVARDPTEAVKWYRLSTQQGLPEAQFRLGFMYANERSIDRSDVDAATWCERAAQQAYAMAQ
jgi:TPR repeat protein